MVLDTFRWFMSTVAQTLGAVSAIVVAVYIMWRQRQRVIRDEALDKARDRFEKLPAWKSTFMQHFNCKNVLGFLHKLISAEERVGGVQATLTSGHKKNEEVLSNLVSIHRDCCDENKKIQIIENMHSTLVTTGVNVHSIIEYFLRKLDIRIPSSYEELCKSFLRTPLTTQDIDSVRTILYLGTHQKVYNELFSFHDKYQDASDEIRKTQQLWIPLLISFITIIGSLAALMFDGCIVYRWYWDWTLTTAVMAFAGTALGWYFVFLYRVISPRSKKEREELES